MSSDFDEIASTVPLAGVRGMIASKMRSSLSESAQLTYHADVDASALIEKRRLLNEAPKEAVGVEDLIIHVLAKVLKAHPMLNGTVKNGAAQLLATVNMSVAMDLESGLVAPAIFDTGSQTVQEISRRRRALLERAKKGKLTVKEMTGGSFTLSNLGLTRVTHFTPILNAPQIAMLGVGRIEKSPKIGADGT
ncbi:MAG: 2-oxo acid dehydrogenase subunit E2, partial [Pseudomonadota bacterium]